MNFRVVPSRNILQLLSAVLLWNAAAHGQSRDLSKARQAIQHLVIIYQENVSFDHYFGTYPNALNSPGEPAFKALPGTPAIDGYTDQLLKQNPNFLNPQNDLGRTNPFRLSRAQAATAQQDHSYQGEQMAFDGGKMDLFPKAIGRPDGPTVPGEHGGVTATTGLTLGYYDGNTVTAYWNYAQHYAMSDEHFGTIFGPSTIGAINLISGQTNGAVNDQNAQASMVADGGGGFSLIANGSPLGDVCSATSDALVHMTGRNIGDLLTKANVTWGFFAGGFDLGIVNPNGTTGCARSSQSPWTKVLKRDYVPYHQPFQFYHSTANPKHTRPSSVGAIGSNHDGGTNHQYDIHDFMDALEAGNFPTVSILKAPGYQDGHSGYSSPLDEQQFVVKIINFLQQQAEWNHTAVIVAYDDSNGWYDHKMAPLRTGSSTAKDALDGPGKCGDSSKALPGVNPETTHAQGRCGPGPRLPLLIISPWSRINYVDHTQTDQTSILRLIEDLYLKGERIGGGSFDAEANTLLNVFDFSKGRPLNTQRYLLDPNTGVVQRGK